MEEQGYNNEENGQEVIATLRKHLFNSKDQEKITQKEYAKSCKRFNKHVLLYLIENPGLLAIILSIMSGCLLAIWSLATTIILSADVQNTDHIVNFINNMNDSMSWVALLSAAFVCVVYTIVSSWGREKFCERKYGEMSNGHSQENEASKWGRYLWMGFNVIVVCLNVFLILLFVVDSQIPEQMIRVILFALCLIVNLYHCWTLTDRKKDGKSLRIELSKYIGLVVGAGLFSLIILNAFSLKYANSKLFIDPIFIFIFLYSVLWIGFIGAQCIGESISRSVPNVKTDSNSVNRVKSIRYWIMRDLRIWIITFIFVCLLMGLAFVGWIIVTANIVQEISSPVVSFFMGS